MAPVKRVGLPPAPELFDGPDLLLRLPVPADVDDIVVQCHDAESQRWTTIPVPYKRSHAHEFLGQVREGWQAQTATFAVEYQGRFAGSLDLRFDGAGAADVGFGLAPWARGKGVLTRALRLALAWCFEVTDVQVVHWRAHVGNWASRRVVVRCGFRVEGTVRGLLAQRGERRDAWIGSLRRGEALAG